MPHPIWCDGERLFDYDGQPLWADRGPVAIISRRSFREEGEKDELIVDEEEEARERADARKKNRQRRQ